MKWELIRKPRIIFAGFSNRFLTMRNYEWWDDDTNMGMFMMYAYVLHTQ